MNAATTRILDDEPGEVPGELTQPDPEATAPTNQEIAELAYSYWEARGYQQGSPWEDWFRAEQELKRRQAR